MAKLIAGSGDFADARQLLLAVAAQEANGDEFRAWMQLGLLYANEGRADEAAQAFEFAAAGDPRTVPDVHLNLAARWACVGAIERAIDTYRRITEQISSQDPELAALALYRVGHLYEEQGELESAISCWRSALTSADESVWPHAAVDLARTLETIASDAAEIQSLLNAVIESDHPDLAPAAALMLARRTSAEGEFALARQLCQTVLSSEHPEFIADAQRTLDELTLDWVHEVVSDVARRTDAESADHGPADESVPCGHMPVLSTAEGTWLLPRLDDPLSNRDAGSSDSKHLTFIIGLHIRRGCKQLDVVELDVDAQLPISAISPSCGSDSEAVVQWMLPLTPSRQSCESLVRSLQQWLTTKLPALISARPFASPNSLAAAAARVTDPLKSFFSRGWMIDAALTFETAAGRSRADLYPLGATCRDPTEQSAAPFQIREVNVPGVPETLMRCPWSKDAIWRSPNSVGWPPVGPTCQWLAGTRSAFSGTSPAAASVYKSLPNGQCVVDCLTANRKLLPPPERPICHDR